MSTLFITVWDVAAEVAQGDPIQEMTITISGTSAQSTAITADSRRRKRVRLFTDTDCFVTWGSDPTAASGSSRPMGAENPEYFDIEAGHKIAVITR